MSKPTRGPLTIIYLVACLAAVAVAFQNCGELRPSTVAVQSQSSLERRYLVDKQNLNKILSSPELKVWVSSKDAVIDSSGGNISSIQSRINGGLSLGPAPSLTAPDIDTSYSVGPVLRFAPGKGLATSTSADFVSTSYTVVALVDAPLNGPIFRIYAGSSQTEELLVTAESGGIRATHYTTSADHASISDNLYQSSGPLVIAISFGAGAKAIRLQVNGVIVRNPAAETGSPVESSNIQRQLIIGNSNFRLGEVFAMTTELNDAELNTLSRYIADRWGFKGVSYDPGDGPTTDGPPAPTDQLPPDVKRIVMGCATAACHSHLPWSNHGVSMLMNLGLVRAGDALNSPLYTRLQGSEGSNSNKNMPLSGSISPADVAIIKNWINSLN